MRLTLHADYALRVLMYAALKGDELSTIGEFSGRFDISRSHVMKVVHELGRFGYIETVQGKNGGFRLSRRPGQINIGAVVRDAEQELGVIGCLQQDDYCRIQPACVLRTALSEATQAFLFVLDAYSLEDLIQPARPLYKLLELDAPQFDSRT
jgi:Rrf2 family nitric oxide-sensitive transcriptional repressor